MISAVPIGQLLEDLYLAVDAATDDEQKRALRALNLAYYDLCGRASWASLRASQSFDFSAADADNGLWLPASLAGVDAVYDATPRYYIQREKASSQEGADAFYRWYILSVCRAPLVYARGLSVNKGAATITPAQAAAHVGEYLRIASEFGFYKLTAVDTITPIYMGPKQDNVWYQVRPEGTQRFTIVDDEGAFEANTVTVDYWEYPAPLYDPSQMLLIPAAEALHLGALIRLLRHREQEGRIFSMQREYEAALVQAQARNPRYLCPLPPQSASGVDLGWGASSTND